MPTALDDRIVPLSELARRWGWSAAKLKRLADVDAIPHLRVRGRVYFRLSSLDGWLESAERGRRRQERANEPQRSRIDERRALGLPDENDFGL